MKKILFPILLFASLIGACGDSVDSKPTTPLTAEEAKKVRIAEIMAGSKSNVNDFLPIAKAQVEIMLTDPSSAQFRASKVDGPYFCIEVNAKNKMGGYVGFRWFSIFMLKPYPTSEVTSSSSTCKN